MKIITIPLGSYQTNCYILAQGDRCLVIDPGDEADKVLGLLEKQGLTLEAILLTHGHFDHVGAVKTLAAETDCRVYLCQEELALPGAMTAGPLFYTDFYKEGDRLTLAGLSFEVLHTPGHTPGSVCLRFDEHLFSGDTLFAGSCGRTDFPGSNPRDMVCSLSRLSKLEDHLKVYPGHGGFTTIGEEKRYNPYL
jgi:glyoxylase-like metal-dependent hydrolase (beta-lactamase superfamily II)